MPSGQIESLNDIETAWSTATRESDKRAVWRMLVRGGWLRACREAVHKRDLAMLEAWLDKSDTIKQDLIQFHSAEAAQMVHTHLLCSLTACETLEAAPDALIKTRWEAVALQPNASGFCRDLMQALLGKPLHQAERDLSLTVLLVDTARDEGVVATLTLELIPDGSRTIYPVPELAFLRDNDFRHAENQAGTWSTSILMWRQDQDIRWRLHRQDGKPLTSLTGPSLGAAFALGIAKLCTGE